MLVVWRDPFMPEMLAGYDDDDDDDDDDDGVYYTC